MNHPTPGTLVRLATASLAERRTAFAATFLAVLCGTAVAGSFATLVQTALGDVAERDGETLLTMGTVVGGWSIPIVLFAVVSTVGITVAQRDVEVGLLRTIGATPGQVKRLVRLETLLVATVGAVAGAVLATVGGRALLAGIRGAGMVADDVAYAGGPAALGTTVVGVLLVTLVAAGIAGRRATRGAPSVVPGEGRAVRTRLPRWRYLAAFVCLAHGVSMAVLTIVSDSDDPYDAMATSGSLSIVVGLGLALLSPVLLRLGARALRPVVGTATPEAHLAVFNAERRSALLAGVLGPVIVLTSAAGGTLMLVDIDGRTLPGGAGADTDTINLLNNVVVGMLTLFAAIMVVNSFVAVTSDRRAELHRLWLLGATRAQVESSVVTEAVLVAAVGVAAGLVASLFTIVPFAVARDEGVVPDGGLWLPAVVAVAVVALTYHAGRGAVRRVARQAVGAQR